jgi:hypothetical protein
MPNSGMCAAADMTKPTRGAAAHRPARCGFVRPSVGSDVIRRSKGSKGHLRESAAILANKPSEVEHPPGQYRGKAMRVLAATLTLLVSSAASAQECKTCSMADACMKKYLKAASEAQTATKQAVRDWKQNLDRKASAELSSRGTAALQDAMEAQVRLELERLKECLAKIR